MEGPVAADSADSEYMTMDADNFSEYDDTYENGDTHAFELRGTRNSSSHESGADSSGQKKEKIATNRPLQSTQNPTTARPPIPQPHEYGNIRRPSMDANTGKRISKLVFHRLTTLGLVLLCVLLLGGLLGVIFNSYRLSELQVEKVVMLIEQNQNLIKKLDMLIVENQNLTKTLGYLLSSIPPTSTAMSITTTNTPTASTPITSTPNMSTPTTSTPPMSTPFTSTPFTSTPNMSTLNMSITTTNTPTASTPITSTLNMSIPTTSTAMSINTTSTPTTSTPFTSTPNMSTPTTTR